MKIKLIDKAGCINIMRLLLYYQNKINIGIKGEIIMDKLTFIRKIQEKTTLEVSQKDLTEIVNSMEAVIKEAVLAGDFVTLQGICKITSKDVPAKTGVSKLHGKETPWEKPAHKEGMIQVMPAFKKIFE